MAEERCAAESPLRDRGPAAEISHGSSKPKAAAEPAEQWSAKDIDLSCVVIAQQDRYDPLKEDHQTVMVTTRLGVTYLWI